MPYRVFYCRPEQAIRSMTELEVRDGWAQFEGRSYPAGLCRRCVRQGQPVQADEVLQTHEALQSLDLTDFRQLQTLGSQ
jgi:hypothetical protein